MFFFFPVFLFTEFEGILRKYRNLFCNRKTYNFAKWVSRLLLHLNSKIFLNSCIQVLFMENLTRFLWLSKTDLVNLVLFEHIKLWPSKCLLLFSEFRRRKIKKINVLYMRPNSICFMCISSESKPCHQQK